MAQAHAWVALGKLCLASEALAKRCVPLLVQELRAAAAPAVRNNIMVALADLCIQVPALRHNLRLCGLRHHLRWRACSVGSHVRPLNFTRC